MSPAARFSRRWSIERVPGIGRITGERRSSQASFVVLSPLATQRVVRHERDAFALAEVDDVVVLAVPDVVAVLHGGDRHDLAGALDLLDAHLGEADVADRATVDVAP